MLAYRQGIAAAAATLLLAACARPFSPGTESPRPAAGPAAADLAFIVIGDWGERGHPGQRAVARRMSVHALEQGVDFIVSTGDNFYPGGVASVADPRWQDTFESIYALPGIAELRWFAVLGNHDYQGSYRAQIDYGRKSSRWIMPATYHYAVERVDADTWVTFAFLDTNALTAYYRTRPERYIGIDAQDADAQIRWLDAVLRCAPPGWKLAVGHHPMYSARNRHNHVTDLQQNVLPLFQRHDVHVYFAGHDHHLEHVKPEDGTHFVVSGGGFGSEPNSPSVHSLFQVRTAGFVAASVTRHRMEIRFIGASPEPLYRVTVERDANDSRPIPVPDGATHLRTCMRQPPRTP